MARSLAFEPADLDRIEIAVMELGTNQLKHADGGQISAEIVVEGLDRGLRIEASDQGPGIVDLARAMEPGFSTTGTLGTGLPTVRELMDRFEVETTPGAGTFIRVEKWRT